ADGTHTFVVEVVDAAGNASNPTPPYSWLIDTVSPVVTLTDEPATLTNQTSASFSFSANQPGSTFACALDGTAFAACTSPLVYSQLGSGSHTFAVRATHLGNTGPATSYTWRVDTIPPDTSVISGPPAEGSSGSASFTFTTS